MFRVVVEEFETSEEACQFRDKLNNDYNSKRAHVEKDGGENNWGIWSFA